MKPFRGEADRNDWLLATWWLDGMPKPGSMIRETNCPASSMLRDTAFDVSAQWLKCHQTADHIFSIVADKLEHQKYNFSKRCKLPGLIQDGSSKLSCFNVLFADPALNSFIWFATQAANEPDGGKCQESGSEPFAMMLSWFVKVLYLKYYQCY